MMNTQSSSVVETTLDDEFHFFERKKSDEDRGAQSIMRLTVIR